VEVSSSAGWGQGVSSVAVEAPRATFEAFFERHHAGLGRLAFLLTGNTTAAEDLTGDVFLAVWRQWDTISHVEAPMAYVRRMMVNTAASRTRRLIRERRRMTLLSAGEFEAVRDPDGAISVDVRAALLRLPVRRRACVVLRHAFDLAEAETAEALGVSVGTVKSQTSKGMAQLQKLLTTSGQERWSA
jgi:RNA polymerase sigma-70 factor (sigma-E family)